MSAPPLGSAVSYREALTQWLRRSFSMISRVLAATVGGYAATSLMTLALPLISAALGINQAQVLLGTTIASFLVWAAIIMAVFHARSAMWTWLWLSGASAPFAMATFLLWPGG